MCVCVRVLVCVRLCVSVCVFIFFLYVYVSMQLFPCVSVIKKTMKTILNQKLQIQQEVEEEGAKNARDLLLRMMVQTDNLVAIVNRASTGACRSAPLFFFMSRYFLLI